MDWAEASAWYNDLEKYGSKPGLEVVSELAHQLGDPQRSLRAIHVSGTNGKGSTCAYAASIMHAAKLCVGLFTSPHLSIFTESVQVNGEKIGEANCARLLTRVRAECEAMEQKEFRHPTIFEVLTVLAFTWFAESRVDVAVVEVGMGGKLDATNIIDADVAVVTNVSLEHTAWLGNTVAKIANVKAGIVKRGATLITAARDPEVLDVLRAVATRQEARLVEVGRDVTMGLDRKDMEGQIFTVRTRKGEYKLETRLPGAHQIVNAATAIAACEALAEGWLPLTHHMVEQGISTTRWPGRFEIVQRNPLVILDGAKDLQASMWFTATARSLLPPLKRVAVVGISSDKDIVGMVTEFVSVCDHVVACTHRVKHRAADPHLIAEIARSSGVAAEVIPDVQEAITRAISLAGREGIVLVVGSIFLVGEARERWYSSKS